MYKKLLLIFLLISSPGFAATTVVNKPVTVNNADKLDGQHGAYYQAASTAVSQNTTVTYNIKVNTANYAASFNVATVVNTAANANQLGGQLPAYYQAASTAVTQNSGVVTYNIKVNTANYAVSADTLDGQHGVYYQPAATAVTLNTAQNVTLNSCIFQSYSLAGCTQNTWYTVKTLNSPACGLIMAYSNATYEASTWVFSYTANGPTLVLGTPISSGVSAIEIQRSGSTMQVRSTNVATCTLAVTIIGRN